MKTNWSDQLRSIEKGEEMSFPVKSYQSILAQKGKLQDYGEGTWSSKRQKGSDTFTVKRTS